MREFLDADKDVKRLNRTVKMRAIADGMDREWLRELSEVLSARVRISEMM